MNRPRSPAPPEPVDNSALDALTAQMAVQNATPTRALPPAVMQDSPWTAGGGRKSAASGKAGAAGTVLTAPGGLVPSADNRLGGKSLLGS